MKISFLAVLLLISACTTKPHTVVYGSHWTASWQNAVMNQCKQESEVIVFAIIDAKISAGYDVTQEDVDMLESTMLHSCLKYYGLFI